MKTLKIFKQRQLLSDQNGSTVLHIDDMKQYPSWMLTQDKMVDNVLYRGSSKSFDSTKLGIDSKLFTETLSELGNPDSIMVTFDKDSKNLL